MVSGACGLEQEALEEKWAAPLPGAGAQRTARAGAGGAACPRRKKTAAERRQQRHRAEGRVVTHLLRCLRSVAEHRGGRLPSVGSALLAALAQEQEQFRPQRQQQHQREQSEQQQQQQQQRRQDSPFHPPGSFAWNLNAEAFAPWCQRAAAQQFGAATDAQTTVPATTRQQECSVVRTHEPNAVEAASSAQRHRVESLASPPMEPPTAAVNPATFFRSG